MWHLGRKHVFWIVVSALLITSLGLSAQAQYTKLYQFTNGTGAAQTSVRATVQGLESVISQYSVPSGWTPATIGLEAYA